MKLKLKDLIDEMDIQMDTHFVFYKKDTNEFILYSEYDTEFNKYDIDEIEESDVFIPIPNKFDIHEYKIMEGFCISINDEPFKIRTLSAIKGSGAFRRFKETVYGTEYENMWYKFKEEKLKDLAISWCIQNNLEYE